MWGSPENECFQKDISLEFSTFAGVWCIAIAAIGFIGNFLTLIAIPYASKKRRQVIMRRVSNPNNPLSFS